MKKTLFVSTLVFLLAIRSGQAADWKGRCESTFDVHATVDSFVGNAVSEPVVFDGDSEVFEVTILIEKMKTGKKKRDAEMRHMFHAEEHPEIKGVAKTADLRNLALGEDGTAKLPFTLTLSGVTREMTATVSDLTKTDDALSFTARFPVTLTDFGLRPPSIMKIIRVADEVKVESKFSFTR